MIDRVASFEEAYRQYTGLLLHALGTLARQRFAVPPDEALDLVHDFFAEEWKGIQQRYDPSRSKLGTYLYAAFIRFARPRIVRILRFRSSLKDAKELLDILEQQGLADPESAYEHDREAARQALSLLPELERDVLFRYLDSAQPSERKLAQELSMSRYKLRALLVDALGRVAVTLGAPASARESDWKVAIALWKEGRSVPEAAMSLGMTPFQIKMAQARNHKILADGFLAIRHTKQHSQRRRIMTNNLSTKELLARAIASPSDRSTLSQLTQRAKELLHLLDDAGQLEALNFDKIEPQCLANIYEAIARGLAGEAIKTEAIDPFVQAAIENEKYVGKAFREVLFEGIPGGIDGLIELLKGVKFVNETTRKELTEEPDVAAGMPEAMKLLPYGITPLTLLHATEAVSMSIRRAMRGGYFSRDEPVYVTIERGAFAKSSSERFDLESFAREISVIANCGIDHGRALFRWTVQASGVKPLLFPRFFALRCPDGVTLLTVQQEIRNVYQRWGLELKEVLGDNFDPERIDIETINRVVSSLVEESARAGPKNLDRPISGRTAPSESSF